MAEGNGASPDSPAQVSIPATKHRRIVIPQVLQDAPHGGLKRPLGAAKAVVDERIWIFAAVLDLGEVCSRGSTAKVRSDAQSEEPRRNIRSQTLDCGGPIILSLSYIW